jgi:hypothetical protein
LKYKGGKLESLRQLTTPEEFRRNRNRAIDKDKIRAKGYK